MPAQHIPTVRYHPTELALRIETAEALLALGPEWLDHPYSDAERAAWWAAKATDEATDEAPDEDETPTPHPRKR